MFINRKLLSLIRTKGIVQGLIKHGIPNSKATQYCGHYNTGLSVLKKTCKTFLIIFKGPNI